jgi:hypothetical protein
MARGGARQGAGRKPAAMYVLPPAAGGASESVASGIQSVPILPPEHLSEAEQEIWGRYAGLAQARGTLGESTAPGFEYLCSVVAQYEALKARVDTEGWTYLKVTIDGAGQEHQEQKKHALWGPLQAFALRREQVLRSYGLLANGRPATTGAPAANPWSSI